MRYLPNYATACMTEFEGNNADCTQDAHESAGHCIDPIKYPMTGASLNALVAFDIANKFADAGGSQNPTGLSNSIKAHDKWPFHQTADWETELHDWGGRKPLIFQCANGQALPGDQAGLHGHAIHCVAWDNVANQGLFCDGDHPNANLPIAYTLAELIAAQPFCVTVIDLDLSVAVDITGLGGGFAAYAEAHDLQGVHTPEIRIGVTPTNPDGAWTFAAWDSGTVLTYAVGEGVKDNNSGWALYHLAPLIEQALQPIPIVHTDPVIVAALQSANSILSPAAAAAAEVAAGLKAVK